MKDDSFPIHLKFMSIAAVLAAIICAFTVIAIKSKQQIGTNSTICVDGKAIKTHQYQDNSGTNQITIIHTDSSCQVIDGQTFIITEIK